MMNTFTSVSFLLFASMAGVARSSLVRGGIESSQALEFSSVDGPRRHLMHESTCTLFRKCVTFGPSEEHPHGHHIDSWVCHLSGEDSSRINGLQFVDIVESRSISETIANATSGQSVLTVSEAIIDAEEPRMYIPEHASIRVHDLSTGVDRVTRKRDVDRDLISSEEQDNHSHHNNRRLTGGPTTVGELRTLVVRLTDKNNVAVTSDVNQLINDVFTDSSSLKTQTEGCSYGKLKIEPFRGNTPSNYYINNGVVDVKMDFDMNGDVSGWEQAGLKAAKNLLGNLEDPMFDLIMVCSPPSPKSNFLAFAFPNSKYSFYNNEWCGYVSGQMHEVGHNLGLGHSGETGDGEYGDGTGYMGFSQGTDDWKMCYNPQKSYQLGWYEDQTKVINPLDGVGRREFVLNGVADYGENKDAVLVLRLRQVTPDQDFYIGFNRAVGINEQTGEHRNMVTIIRKDYGAPDEYAQSTKVAALRPGQRVIIPNFNGSNKDVQIAFTGLTDDGRDARVIVLDNDQVPPPPPGSCTKFVVEVITDGYPDDNEWYIKDKGDWGRIAAISMPYQNENTKYRQEVCLPQGRFAKNYVFAIEDKYGDGMGSGSYKVFNHQGQLQFQGGNNFSSDNKWATHNIMVEADPNPPPPTKPPTTPPTEAPTESPPCVDYFVEVKTDTYPGDSSWQFLFVNEMNDEKIIEESPAFEKQKTVTHKVCLYDGRQYTFRFKDSYGDGLCCGNSEESKGYYKVKDACGRVFVDSGQVEDDFKERDYPITAEQCSEVSTPDTPEPTEAPVLAPVPAPTLAPTKKAVCKNKVKKRFKVNPKSKKKNCKWYAKKKHCNKTVEGGKNNGKKISELCAKNCKAC